MSIPGIRIWERDFREDAKADKYARLRRHLRKLELPAKPELLLEGTIEVVRACAELSKYFGRSSAEFLRMQTYDPKNATGAEYVLTFDVYGKTYGRVLVGSDFGLVDFACLYAHSWEQHEMTGFNEVWISCVDGSHLSDEQAEQIEAYVGRDLEYDYDDEVGIWCAYDDDKKALQIYVYDQPEE